MRVFHIYRIQRKIRWKFYPALNLCLFNASQFSDQMKKLTLFGLNLTLFGVKLNPFFLQIIVANCWTESPLIKMFLPTSSPTTRTPSVKDFFTKFLLSKTFSFLSKLMFEALTLWKIFANSAIWLSTYKMYIFGTIPLLRIYKVYKSNSSFFITDCGGYKQF